MQWAQRAQSAQACGIRVDVAHGREGGGRAATESGRAGAGGLPEDIGGADRDHLAAEVARLRRELARAERRIAELEHLADSDMMTPVLNRRAFARELARLLSLCGRCTITASLIYFDLDDLKRINDQFGHEAGDAVLLHVARLIRSRIRGCDFVGRLGGDEFGVVLLGADRAAAERKAQGLATALAARPLWWQERPITLSMAFGVCPLCAGMDVAAILARADRAMYRRKRSLKTTMFDLFRR